MREYRTDIDGLRAIAVIAVIFFHLGYLENGYLGVDIFFAISGYLISSIIYTNTIRNSFSIIDFYVKRLRRIFPLVLFTSFIALIIGMYVMLPYDLKNLSYSVIATNFSVNNIVTRITSSNYWNIVNDYKPLMHTWSLGIEEQFYLLYPFLFAILSGKRIKFILPVLVIITLASLTLFCFSNDVASKFYLLQYRFYELSAGGLCSLFFIKYPKRSKYFSNEGVLMCLIILLICVLTYKVIAINDYNVIVVIILTCAILVYGQAHYNTKGIYHLIFCNQALTYIGKLSFSLYMWHQVVFAYARYVYYSELTFQNVLLLLLITFILSVVSYNYIEKPFRDKKIISRKQLLIVLGVGFIVVNGLAYYNFWLRGNVRSIPELNLSVPSFAQPVRDYDEFKFNLSAHNFDKSFVSNHSIKVLVIGDSYARDFTNILRKWKSNYNIQLSYTDTTNVNPDKKRRVIESDYIFYATSPPPSKNIKNDWLTRNIPKTKRLYIVGIKDFGNSNGIHYNVVRHTNLHSSYRSHMKNGIFEINQELKKEWGNQYIDLISLIIDKHQKIEVFTPEGKFISFDTLHLTEDGAAFFAQKLSPELYIIFKQSETIPHNK